MANPMKGEVSFVNAGDGATYKLVFSINALVTLEETLGIATTQIGELLNDKMKISDLRTLFWAGLIDNHDVNQEGAGVLMNGLGVAGAAELIGRALALAFPEAAKGTARPRQAAAGTGQSS